MVGQDGQPSGSIMATDKEEGEFTAEDETLLRQLAAIASLGLQHIEAREESEQRATELGTTFSAIRDGLLILGPDDEIVRMNQAAERLVGVTTEQWMRVPPVKGSEVIGAETADGRPLALEDTPRYRAEHGEEVVGFHMALSRPDGSRRIVHTSAGPIRDAEGHITGTVVNWTDVTSEVTLREQIDAERARLETVLESLPVGVWVTDERGQIIRKNQASDRIWAGEAPLSKSIEDYPQYTAWYADSGEMLRPEDYPVAQALQTGQSVGPVELRIRRFDGSEGTVLVSATPIKDAQGQSVGVIGVNVDITARKQAEEEAKRLADQVEAERRLLQAVIEYAPFGISILQGPEHRYIVANPEFQPFVRGKGNVIGRTVAEVFPEVADQIVLLLDRVYRTGEPYYAVDSPFTLIRDGKPEQTYFTFIYAPWYDQEGRIQGVMSLALETTERKRVEDALRESEERFATAFRANPNALVLSRVEDGMILDVNDAFLDLFQWTRDEVIGKTSRSLNMFAHPEERDQMIGLLRQSRHLRDYEIHIRRKSGEERIAHLSSEMLQVAEGPSLLTILQDVTERRQAEEALRESEERFRLLADNMSQFAWMADETGWIFWYNKRWYEYTGTTLEEMRGWGWQKVHHPGHVQRVVEKFSHSLATGEVWEDTFPLRGKDGQYRWFLSRAIPIRDEQGKVVRWFGTNTDITELREAEEALRETQGKLRALNETLEQQVIERTARLRGLSLELTRTEERERRRLAQLLHDHLQQLLAAARISVNMVRNRSQDDWQAQTLGQVDGLLDESIAESRSLTAELSPPVLYDAGLAAALNWLARWMEEKHHLHVEVEAEDLRNQTPLEIRMVLFQGARELLFNVVKHAKVDQARLELRRLPEDQVELVVSDQGVGMDPAQMGKQRATDGFGLFNVRERLESLGGRMQMESAPGEGTRITLQVPLRPTEAIEEEAARAGIVTREMVAVAAEELVAEREKAERAAVAGVRVVRVVLADDHVIMRKGLARLLEDEPGIELVGQANDGREAVDLAHVTRPDIVLMDVSMPVMDGIEATRRIASELPESRVIGLSMYADPEVAQRMREAGAVDHIPKGGNPAELVEAVRRWAKS